MEFQKGAQRIVPVAVLSQQTVEPSLSVTQSVIISSGDKEFTSKTYQVSPRPSRTSRAVQVSPIPGVPRGISRPRRVRIWRTSGRVADWRVSPEELCTVSITQISFQETRTALNSSGTTGWLSKDGHGGGEEDRELWQHHCIFKMRSKAFQSEIFVFVRH